MPADGRKRAIIIGAGPGGLAAAIALRQVGIAVKVFEAAQELRPIGAGLTLWTNAVKATDQLGLTAAIQARAGGEVGGEIRSWRGPVLARIPATMLARTFGAANIAIHRAELQAAMLDVLDVGIVETGARCLSFAQDADEVRVQLADGREVRGDLLIGADGIHSVVREQLFGISSLRYAGYTAWRGVTHVPDAAFPPGRGFLTLGPGGHMGFVHIGPSQVYWFAALNAAAGGQDAPRGGRHAVLAHFGGWHGPIRAIVAATAEAAILRTDLYDRPPILRWTAGRVTLLGDAAHPMTPNLGQGACQALEDAVVLARCLQARDDIPAALGRYETARIPRTTAVVNTSWRV